MISTLRSSLSLLSLAWLSACGAAVSPPQALYSAEQLNAFATPPPPEEVPGASDPNARPVFVAPEPPPPPRPARLRFIHASPDPEAASVAVSLDDAAAPAVASLAYKSAAGYAELPPGVHTVQLRAASAAASTPPALSGSSPDLSSGSAYTVIAYGVAGTPALAVTATPDSSPEPDAGHAHLRFFHALVGLGAVDVCLPGASASAPATPVFADVAFGAFGRSDGPAQTYVGITTEAPVTLQLRQHSATVCRGRVVGHVALTLTERSVRTIVAVGRTASPGNPAVPSEVLVCTDANGTTSATNSECSTEPLRPGAMPRAPHAPRAPRAPRAARAR